MSREEIEDYQEYLHKFAEKLQMASLAIKDGKDPTDEQWDVLEEIHRIWYNGNLPLFKTVIEGSADVSVQTGLF